MGYKHTDNGLAGQAMEADGAINAFCIVIPGTDAATVGGNQVKVAADDHSAPLLGAIQNDTVADGDPVTLPVPGMVPKVKLGGAVSRGDFLTAKGDGSGQAIKISLGDTAYTIGQAGEAGADGDVIPYVHAPAYIP